MSKFKFTVSGDTENLGNILDLIDLNEFEYNYGMTVICINTFTEKGGYTEPRFEFLGRGGEDVDLEDMKEQFNQNIKKLLKHTTYKEIKIEKIEFEK